MSRLHTRAVSGDYAQAMLTSYQSDPASVPSDWRLAFDLLTAGVLDARPAQGADQMEFLRRFGHLGADLDPLGRSPTGRWGDLAATVLAALSARLDSDAHRVASAYCGRLAVELGHLDDPVRADWVRFRREAPPPIPPEARVRALEATARGEAFERFMGLRFPGKKRFGAEGAESLHALLQRLLDRAAGAGVSEVVVAAMHRGRLGLMTNLLGQSPAQLFARMRGGYPLARPGRAADVPYHAGLDHEVDTPHGRLRIRLLPNPSHLEAIDPVACGYARGRQDRMGSAGRVLPILLHTDASVVAQGVVAETLQLSEVAGHRIGGAVHVVINNQVGFTTDPDEARSSRHCTGPWKAIDSLIAHVNGDDVDAVLAAADLAFDYRERFAGESVIDLVCLRANGHNELDEPRFTQPVYYALAQGRPAISHRYEVRLLEEGLVAPGAVQSAAAELRRGLEEAFEAQPGAATDAPCDRKPFPAREPASLAEIAAVASRIPQAAVNPKAARLVAQRADEASGAVTWATAETCALGAVLSMGLDVRLTGQDVQRGPFSQRHLALVDDGGIRHPVFESSPPDWGRLQVFNTPLCEYAALGFEYGYSIARPEALTIWEAQFGDFANGAQTVFDQFIASAAEKWDQPSRLVVLLPHGLEGQGPEHSSARIERMLQLAARDNLRIAHPSTPANYYQLLLGQGRDASAPPLIVFTPKKLLRLKAAVSTPQAFAADVGFQATILDRSGPEAARLICCSGKIAYDVIEAIDGAGRRDVAVLRLEQLYPFPADDLRDAMAACPSAELVWLQEEPRNFGAWSWLREPLDSLLAAAGRGPAVCVARAESPSPAGSFHSEHEADQAALVTAALGPGKSGGLGKTGGPGKNGGPS